MYCFPLWEFCKVIVRILRAFAVLKYSVLLYLFVLQSVFHGIQKNAINDMYR